MNSVVLTGRLTNEPKIRYTSTGKTVCSFCLAVNNSFSHNKENNTSFFYITAWQKLAEICGNNLVKGKQILVKGFLQNNNGVKKFQIQIVANRVEFLGKKTDNQSNSDEKINSTNENTNVNAHSDLGSELPPDEQIPF